MCCQCKTISYLLMRRLDCIYDKANLAISSDKTVNKKLNDFCGVTRWLRLAIYSYGTSYIAIYKRKQRHALLLAQSLHTAENVAPL